MINPLKEVNWNPGKPELRVFSKSLMLGFPILASLLGALRWIRTSPVPEWVIWLGIVGFCAGLLTLLLPRLAPPLYVLWHVVTGCIGLVVSNSIIAAIYYLVITPVGLLLRATGRDPMERKMLSKDTTYWKDAGKPESRSDISGNPKMNEHEPDAFEKAAQQKPPGLVREIIDLLRSNRKWWLVPVLIVLLGVGAVIAFAMTSPAAAPFIYSLF